MAEFVSLPIYGSNGMATGRSLRINVRFFLGSAGVLANRFMEIVDEVPAEIDALDRIVHGLPVPNKQELLGNWTPREKPKQLEDDVIPDPVEAGRLSNTAFIKEAERQMLENGRLHSVSVEPGGYFGSIELVDTEEAPELRVEDKWRVIPGFSNYEMSPYRAIATGQDGLSVSIMRGRVDNVLLIDDEGNTKRMSVDYLFQRTFPELVK